MRRPDPLARLQKPQSSSASKIASVGTAHPLSPPWDLPMALAEKQRQRNAGPRAYLAAGKVWLSICSSAIGSDKFPRFLAWREHFSGLEVTAFPFPHSPSATP